MTTVLYIFIIMIMRVLQSLYSKKAAVLLPNGIKPYVSYVFISKLFASLFAILLIVISMDLGGINMQAVLIASCSGISLAIGSLCGVKALSGGTIALNSMFGTAGMIIPVILGIFFFNENVSFVQWICIAVLFVAMFMLVSDTKNVMKGFEWKTLIYLIGSFLSNGIVMFCQKLFGFLQPDGNVTMFSMLTFLIPTAVLAIVLPFIKNERGESGEKVKMPKMVILYAAVLAFAVFMIQQLVTLLTPVMSSAVLFTLVNGGATVIATAVGALVYKEKITLKSGLGVVIGIVTLILIKVFE